MIKVNVVKEINYPIKSSNIKKVLTDFLKEKNIKKKVEVNVSVVSLETMNDLGKRYLKEKGNREHNVLSFTASESKEKFVEAPDDVTRLGEIVICFPVLKEEAKDEGLSIDEKVKELVLHGALHLLGVHHDWFKYY